ncbi:MAG: hypothetical protein R6U04_06030 [Bacteroidales bacterium]
MKVSFVFRILLPGLFLCLLSQTIKSQPLSEQLGAIKTNFVISTSNGDLPVVSQSIVKRAYHDYKHDEEMGMDGQSSYGYGYGMQSLHFEFVTDSDVSEVYRDMKKTRIKYYEVKLLDENEKVLSVQKYYDREVKKGINKEGFFAWSVSLHSVPLLLLDMTEKISITRIRTYK